MSDQYCDLATQCHLPLLPNSLQTSLLPHPTDCYPTNYCFSVLCDGGIATMSSILNSTSHKPSLSPLSPLKTLHNDCHDPGIEAKQCASQHARVGFAQSIIYRGFICAHTQSFKQCTHTVLCLNSQLPSPLLAVLHTAGRSHLLAAHHNGRGFSCSGFSRC